MRQAIIPKPHSAWLGHAGLPEQIRLRELNAGDCLTQLTRMLHRAFSKLCELGIPCSCVNQTPEGTRQRVTRGHCFVAVCRDQIVGTITLYAPDTASDSNHYRDARVASIRQLGVDPRFQSKGFGTALLHLAERWARHRGYTQLALDTPEPADHLIDYYHRQGFHVVETLQFSGRPYRSLIFTKSLLHHAAADRRPLCPHGRRRALVTAPPPKRHLRTMRRANAIPCSCLAYRPHMMAVGANSPREGR